MLLVKERKRGGMENITVLLGNSYEAFTQFKSKLQPTFTIDIFLSLFRTFKKITVCYSFAP